VANSFINTEEVFSTEVIISDDFKEIRVQALLHH
jgi:hypothetical protein